MTENINDSIEEAVVAEEVTQAPEAVVEEAVEAPVVETPVETPAVEEKPKATKKSKAEPQSDTVALYSDRNYAWDVVGKLKAGQNLVSKDDAEQWLGASLNVRIATPEEVAAKAASL